MTPLFDWCKHVATFWDSQGHYVGRKRLDYNSPTFTFLGRGYNFIPLLYSSFKDKDFLGFIKYYFYNLDNPDALQLRQKIEPATLNSFDYGTLLKSDAIIKINNLTKQNWLLSLLTPVNIIIGIVIIGVIYWVSTHGGKLW